MPPKFGKLLAGLGEGAIAHFGNAAGVVQRIASLRCHLIDAPDRLTGNGCRR